MSVNKQDLIVVQGKLNDLENKALAPFKKNIKAVGYITFLLEKAQLKPIIVGGHAVELYTSGHYTTVDVDLVVSDREKAGEILERVDFIKFDGRHWYHQNLRLPIEFAEQKLFGAEDRVIEVETDQGFKVYAIGVEDLILELIKAYAYKKSLGDWDWALSLLVAQWKDIDFTYLRTQSEKETGRFILPYVENALIQLLGEGERYQKNS